MNKRLGCWALSLLLAVAMLAAVPFAQGATVLHIGAGGDFPTVGEAFASLGENTGDLTLLLSEDLGETGDLVVPADRGITSLTLDSGDGQNHTLGAYRFFANGVPLTVDRAKVRYLYGGGLDRTVPSTKVTVRGGSIGWLMGGGTADQPGGEARVTGQAAVTFDHADTVFHSDDYLWGGGYANVQGVDVSVGSVKIEILDTDLPEREIMGGGMASDRNCNADAGQVSITIRNSTLHGDVYGGGHCDTATASARSQNTSVTIVDSDFPLYNGDYGGNILGGGFLFNGGGSVDISGTAKLDIRNSTITAAIGGPLGLSSKSASAGNTSVTLQHCTVRQLVSGGCYSGDGIAAVQCENADVRIVDGITFPDGGAIYAQGYVEEKGTAVATGRASLSIEGAAVSVDAISDVTDLTLSAPSPSVRAGSPPPPGRRRSPLKAVGPTGTRPSPIRATRRSRAGLPLLKRARPTTGRAGRPSGPFTPPICTSPPRSWGRGPSPLPGRRWWAGTSPSPTPPSPPTGGRCNRSPPAASRCLSRGTASPSPSCAPTPSWWSPLPSSPWI